MHLESGLKWSCSTLFLKDSVNVFANTEVRSRNRNLVPESYVKIQFALCGITQKRNIEFIIIK